MATKAVMPEIPPNFDKGSTEGSKWAKETLCEWVAKGFTIQDGLDALGYHRKTYDYWRQSDPRFRAKMDKIRGVTKAKSGAQRAKARGEEPKEFPDFPTFCEEYLDTKLFRHQLQWYDVLEGREPRDLHPSQRYIKGDPGMVIVNTPPEHAKSTTITVNYTTYRVCQDPNIRIIIVSQTQEMAKRFLRAVKDRLAGANPAYKKLQRQFAPQGGFDDNSASWTADAIYVNSETRDSGEATPTVQALGINGQIYGNRADLIILDDTVTGKNAHEFAKQIDWIQREVINRLTYPGGVLLLVGTRLAPVELYSEIQKPEWYGQDEESPWTYLTQPAVLEYADDPDDWVVLAPWTNRPPVSLGARKLVEPNESGLYPWHTGRALARRRATASAQNWSMVYQQEQVSSDMIFKAEAVVGCIDKTRPVGVMPSNNSMPGFRRNGMEGLYVVGGFDPAMTGHSAAVVIGMDRYSGTRWVLDSWTRPNCKPDDIFDKIKELTVKYKINEWRIEKNAMNLMVTQNRDIRTFLANRGCLLKEHFTGSNKWDADFGVASMSMLFDGWEDHRNLIRLPTRSANEGVKALVEQLTTWFPETKGKTDLVMALWFAEIRCRELVNEVDQIFSMPNHFLSQRDKENQMTVDLDHASVAQQYYNGGAEWWS